MSSLLNHFFRKRKTSQFSNPNKSMSEFLTSASTENSISKSDGPGSLLERSQLEKPINLSNFSISTSSVFNTPIKKSSFMQNLYGMLEEQMDNIGGILSLPEHSRLPPGLTDISSDDFRVYVEKMSTSYDSFLKEKEHATHESFEKEENTDITGNLMTCYRKVPQQYFDSHFHFNFTWLDHGSQDIVQYQADLEEYRDSIEKNMYYQISSKFGTILSTIQQLIDQENEINRCMLTIRKIRAVNQDLKAINSGKMFEVMKLKKKQINIQRTLQVLEMMNLVKKIIPTLKHLIQRGNFENAVNLLEGSENTVSQKLSSINCLQAFKANFQQARTTLQQLLIVEFENRSFEYLSKCLSYTKKRISLEDVFQDSEEGPSDLISRRLGKDLYIEPSDSYKLEWTLEECADSSVIAEQVSRIILAHIKLKEVSLASYRPKLNELLKKFHKQFTTDMNEHLASINTQPGPEGSSQGFMWKVQFVAFYFRAYKRFLLNFSEVNNHVLCKVVSYFDSKTLLDSEAKDNSPLNPNSMKILTQTAQEFYSVFNAVMRNFNDKMTQVIQLVELNNVSATQFLLFEEVLEEIITFFKEKFDFQETLYSSITTQNELLKKTLTKIISSFLDQMSISSITNLRLIIEKQYIQLFSNNKKEDILKKLRQESWQAVDVALDKVKSLNLVYDTVEQPVASPTFSPSTDCSEVSSAKIRDIHEEETLSPALTNENILSKDTNFVEERKGIVSIKKKIVAINGKKYKVTASFLDFVQTLAELYVLSQKFGSIREESISKIFMIMKLFSSTVDHEILKGNASSGAKGGVITPEILAFAATSISLMEQAIDILRIKLEKNSKGMSNVLENEANQAKTELNSLNSKLLAKISEILRDVVLIEKCNKLKLIHWEDSHEKLSAPTSLSVQILEKILSVYKKISLYLPQEQLLVVFKIVLNDLGKLYVPVFEEFDVKNGLAAKRIKRELNYFLDNLKRIEIFGECETSLYEFEERITTLMDHKCGPFIELASLDDEKEAEAAV